MNVVAINGSPKAAKSNTDKILQPFLTGAAEAGAVCETVYAAELEVKDCCGCFTCWNKTPGVCVYNDDMPGLLERIRDADYVVWAGPLYFYGMTARLQRIIERTLPLVKPYIIWNGERYVHLQRYEKRPKLVLVSNCGFPERVNFNSLQETFSLLSGGHGPAAAVMCTGGELLGVEELNGQFDWYIAAAYAAGRELIKEGRMADETEHTLARSLVPVDIFVTMANSSWNVPGDDPPTLSEVLSERSRDNTASTQEQVRQLTDTDIGNSMRGLIAAMANNYRPEAERNLASVIQYEVSGNEPGQYFLVIESGRCTAFEGRHTSPKLTIYTSSQIWRSIAEGKLEGSTALMNGQYRFEGDLALLMKLNQLFRSAHPASPVPNVRRTGGPLPIPGMQWLTVAFAPWIAFWVFSGRYGVAACAGALGLATIILFYRWLYLEVSMMDAGSPLFFAAALGLFLVAPSALSNYGMVLGNLTLAALWAGTLMTEQPLTAVYSKHKYPLEIQATPLFIRINVILTTFWVLIYITQAAIAIMAPVQPVLRGIWLAGVNLLLIPAFIFTSRFPAWFISRRANQPVW
ncbi:MAG: NAD(P)H-dependent oxidoreductase [Solirubrobacterales bacterium]